MAKRQSKDSVRPPPRLNPPPPPPPPSYSQLQPPRDNLLTRLVRTYRAGGQLKRGCMVVTAATALLFVCTVVYGIGQGVGLVPNYNATSTAEEVSKRATATVLALTPSSTPTPTYTATATLTPTPTYTATSTQTPSQTFTPSATFTPTLTFTASATRTPTFTPTVTLTPSATFTPTQTYTPSATYTPSMTYTPSATRTPTMTATATRYLSPTPTPSRTPAAATGVTVTATSNMNLRGGPGTNYAVVGTLAAGQTAQAVARNGDWLYLANGMWVAGWLVTVQGSVASLPTRAAPAGGVAPAQPAVPTTAPGTSGCPSLSYTCSQLTCQQAYACLAAGNRSLDRDGDGVPCESICPGG